MPEIQPEALTAFARRTGFNRTGPYGDHAWIYEGPNLPEIIIPTTNRIGDYNRVVAQLLSRFARASGLSESETRRQLLNFDRDVVSFHPRPETEVPTINQAAELLTAVRDLLAGANAGLDWTLQPEPAGIISPTLEQSNRTEETSPREMTRRLYRGLSQNCPNSDTVWGEPPVTADFRPALTRLTAIFPAIKIRFDWALTDPEPAPGNIFRFYRDDAADPLRRFNV